jgi:hypothetical protein
MEKKMFETTNQYMFINSLSTIIKTINRRWKKTLAWHITMSRRLLRAWLNERFLDHWTFQKGIMVKIQSLNQ